MADEPIYLDHAATTPLDTQVLAAMQPYMTRQYFNPSATYEAAREIRRDVEAARATVAHHIGARPAEIVFTAGGTEANNLAIHGVMQQFPGGTAVVSAIEHDSVLNVAATYPVRAISVAQDGRIDLNSLKDQIDDKTVLVSVQYANNEIGTIQPLTEVANLLADIKTTRRSQNNDLPLYLHTDACQAPAYLDIHAARLGVDLMTINASKIYGPKQVGALFIKTGTQVAPQILGGGQEQGRRSGTENVAGIIGLAAALDMVQNRRHEEVARLKGLQKLFIDRLAKTIPSAVVNGSLKHRLPGNVHITIPGQDNERLMMELDNRGILCAVGSACSASNEEPSHVLTAIGLTEQEAQASLRFTMGHSTTEDSISHTVQTLAHILNP